MGKRLMVGTGLLAVLANSASGITGYSAGPGYDLATGLGSVDANALIWNWPGPGSSYPAILRTYP